jgi:hypothetical protein
MKMLEQRIGRRRDATRALPQVPTGWGGYGCPTETRHPAHTVGHKAINPRGMGTESPSQKSFAPNSKKMLTKSGESWSGPKGHPDAPVGHPALDQRYSLASLASPARTGFSSR